MKWITKFRNEPEWDYTKETEKQVRMVYVEDDEAGEVVCRVFGHPDVKVQEDRARLIASAPNLKQQRDDLLAACDKAKDEIGGFLGCCGEDEKKDSYQGFVNVCNLLEAELAKAK